MRDVVEKASHCAWQIHYHIVFPVKYRRGLLDEAVVRIIILTAKEIEERYDIEFEQIGCAKTMSYTLYSASEDCTGSDCKGVQEHYSARIV